MEMNCVQVSSTMVWSNHWGALNAAIDTSLFDVSSAPWVIDASLSDDDSLAIYAS